MISADILLLLLLLLLPLLLQTNGQNQHQFSSVQVKMGYLIDICDGKTAGFFVVVVVVFGGIIWISSKETKQVLKKISLLST